MDEPTPLDPSDPEGALEVLRSYDHDAFLETIAKVGTTIRKWQKQCKDYRDRAKGKISFRNFAKGDLALFLPTRNSLSKPWAAFNVSFPHYFLQATGHLAEQLKTREWIVARITSITERIVNNKDPLSNPFGLGDGTKYYMLQVEDWTQPAPSKRRASGKKTTSERPAAGSLPSSSSLTAPLPPGPLAPAEEEELGTTRPPTSTLFPVRARSSSSPSSGRPSALSRLLAQAPVNGASTPPEPMVPTAPAVTNSRSTSPSLSNTPPEPETEPEPEPEPESIPLSLPAASSPAESASQASLAPPSPTATLKAARSPVVAPQPLSPSLSAGNHGLSHTSSSNPGQSTPIPIGTSPRRPGSRASRMSVSSRRPAFPVTAATGSGAATVKASPTAALSELPELTTSPFFGSPPNEPVAELKTSPSPQGSVTDDMSRLLARRRTTSYHIPRPSPLATTAATAMATPSVSTNSLSVREQQPRPSASSALANLASSWGVPFGRRKTTAPTVHERTDSERTERPSERDT